MMGVQALRFTPYMAATGETGEDLLIPVWPFMAYMGFCALVLAARLIGNPSGEEQIGLGAETPRTGVFQSEAANSPNDGTVPDGKRQ